MAESPRPSDSSRQDIRLEPSSPSGPRSRGRHCPAGLTAGLLLAVAACAAPPPPPPDPFLEPLPPSVAQARDVVVAVQASALEVARLGESLDYEARRAQLMEVGAANFDLPRMARLSYGPGWPDLEPDQQSLWLDTFVLFRFSANAKTHTKYRGQVYRLRGYERVSDETVLIRTALRYPDRALEITIDYRVIRTEAGWKIIDRYSPPSVSEIAMRRSEYRTVLEKEGFEGLILDMERRIEGYSAR